MRRIVRRPDLALADNLPATLHPLVRRIYRLRGVTDSQALDLSLNHLHQADRLANMDHAVELLVEALRVRHTILIVGDFDADGATSTALAVRALKRFGAEDVRYQVPNRFTHGYGLTPELVADIKAPAPDLLITVDNGIANHEGVAAARRAGIKVLITDHHLPGERLPAADAIVNPNLTHDGFPSKHLAGVGVIFYTLAALRARLRALGWFARQNLGEPNMAQFLDLVALGTIADVVTLDANNRILVSQGLKRIRAGLSVPGIQALLKLAGRDSGRLIAEDLAFAIAPRLNAAGRLADMALGIECLLADDPHTARHLAQSLDELNRERRVIESKMHAQATAALATLDDVSAGVEALGLCLYDPGWHQGVSGIVASRLVARLNRPVIVFSPAGENSSSQDLKGSARSIAGLHIRDILADIHAREPDLMTRFGGHAMAAGVSLPHAHLERFGKAFDDLVRTRLNGMAPADCLMTDGELEDFSLEAALALRDAGPWGQGFPAPVFDGHFEVLEHRWVGERHLKLRLKSSHSTVPVEGIAFNARDWDASLTRMHLVFRLEVNAFQGRISPQLVIEHLQPVR